MKPIAIVVAACLVSSPALAGICEYRLSELIGSDATTVIGGSGAAVAGASVAAKAAGVYVLVHSTSGATMLGSTLAGSSAAGTVGIIGGSAGVLGTIGAIVTAPVTLVAAGVTAVGVGVLEGGCYFADERITDYQEVLAILQAAEPNVDPSLFKISRESDGDLYLLFNYDGTGVQKFLVTCPPVVPRS